MVPIVLILVAGIIGVCYLTVQASNNLRQPVEERPIDDIQPDIEQQQKRIDRFKHAMNEKNPDFLIEDRVYNETDPKDISTISDVRKTFSEKVDDNFRTLF